MKTSRQRRGGQQLDAGAMADIAFLLLIFFLVATSILDDQGLLVQLPPYQEKPVTSQLADRNVLNVKINADDQLMVEDEVMVVEELRSKAKDFILNPRGSETLAVSPRKAIVSLQNDRGTSYRAYLSVYNELKAAYRELWEEEARRRYGDAYESLSADKKRAVRTDIPLVISEAEPTDYAPQ